MDDVAPAGWTVRGVEIIHTIDRTGERQQLACAKERHESGDVYTSSTNASRAFAPA
jgi:hypothetical protein